MFELHASIAELGRRKSDPGDLHALLLVRIAHIYMKLPTVNYYMCSSDKYINKKIL